MTRDSFDGISLYERLPLTWAAADLSDPAELDHANHEAARALQALAVFEEMPRDLANDPSHANQDLVNLQAKVDVLLSLVGRLLSQQIGPPVRHSLVLRAVGCEWSGPEAERVKPGETGYISIYANPSLPLALRLPCRTMGSVERSGSRWLQARFELLSPTVAGGLEKLVFRRHRRQVALTKGTGVFTETGIFKASKF